MLSEICPLPRVEGMKLEFVTISIVDPARKFLFLLVRMLAELSIKNQFLRMKCKDEKSMSEGLTSNGNFFVPKVNSS